MNHFCSNEFFHEIMLKKLFIIYNSSTVLDKFLKITKIEEIFKDISVYAKTTGIMIGDVPITENNSLFIFVFDYTIIIINEDNLEYFQSFLNKKEENIQHFFLNPICEQKFKKKEEKTNKNSIEINQTDLCQKVQKTISDCIIQKSQIRTINRRYESFSNNSQDFDQFDLRDFINILNFGSSVYLRFNIRDQFLYILKCYDAHDKYSKIRFERELSFYIVNNVGMDSGRTCHDRSMSLFSPHRAKNGH